MRFADQVVWITGASSGIGAALARAFARDGAHLVLSSRRPNALEDVRRTCEVPDRHRLVPLDVTRPETFAEAHAAARSHHGRIDVLVNNAGVSQRATAMATTLEAGRALMEVNYFGPVALAKTVLPDMLRRRAGHLVVVSSVMGYLGTPGRSSYAAAKHALHGYFDSLRAEVWRENIRVTLACPGYVRTEVARNALGADGRPAPETSPPRGISAERCAAVIVRAVARGSEEVHVGGWEVAGITLQRLAPRLLSRVIRRMRFSGDGRT